MGDTTSDAKRAYEVTVATDASAYDAGDVVSGTVTLNRVGAMKAKVRLFVCVSPSFLEVSQIDSLQPELRSQAQHGVERAFDHFVHQQPPHRHVAVLCVVFLFQMRVDYARAR